MTAIEVANNPDAAAEYIKYLEKQIADGASNRKHAVFCAALTCILASERLTMCGGETRSAVTKALEVVHQYHSTNTEDKLK